MAISQDALFKELHYCVSSAIMKTMKLNFDQQYYGNIVLDISIMKGVVKQIKVNNQVIKREQLMPEKLDHERNKP